MYPPPDRRSMNVYYLGMSPEHARLLGAVASAMATHPSLPVNVQVYWLHRADEIPGLLSTGQLDILAIDPDSLQGREAQDILTETEGGRFIAVVVLDPISPEATEDELTSYLKRLENGLRVVMERRRQLLEDQRRTLALEASEARLKRVIESNVDGIVIIDAQGTLRFLNRATEQLFNTKRELLLGRPFGLPLVERDYVQIQIPHRGEECIVEMRVVEISWQGSNCHLAFLRDVTARVRADRVVQTITRRNNQLVAAISSLNLGVIICDARAPGWPVLFTNHGYCELSGYSSDEVQGQPLRMLEGRDTDPHVLEQIREALRGARSFRGDILNYRKDGGPFWNSLTLNPVFDGDGNLTSVVGVLRDVSDKIRAAQALRDSEASLQALIGSTADLICSLNRAGQIEICNPSFRRLTVQLLGVELGRGTYALEYLDEQHRDIWQDYLQKALEGATFSVEVDLNLPTRAYAYDVSISPIRTPDGRITGATLMARDITERKTAQAQLLHNAFHDVLTGLPNRALLLDRLERAFTRSKRRDGCVGLLHLGLDRFKNIIDYLGFAMGDQLLIAVARRLEDCLRPGDTVARMAGDEFTLLLEEIRDLSDALRICERIQKALQQPFLVNGNDVYTTVSIGIAISDGSYSRPESLLDDAVTAMMRAKKGGRNQHMVFNQASHDDVIDKLKLENALRFALPKQELFLCYQPIVSLVDGSLAGFEALLRWYHPQRGLIPPSEFIPLAERSELIVPIGKWVLETAARQVKAWQERYSHYNALTISVNLSPRQLQDSRLVDSIGDAIAASGLPAHQLKLEVTEGVFAENTRLMRSVLEQVAALGAHVQLDDFCTGYSCLGYLHEFPVNTLKIDQSFVKRLSQDSLHARAIVRTIRDLARHLNMAVVAEGVEKPEQARYLHQLGCEYGQGYYFSRPLTVEQAELILGDSLPPWQGLFDAAING